jgi:hypothetical protein
LLTSFQCILILATGLVCDLYTRPPFVSIFKQIDIGSLVEAVVSRFLSRWSVEIVHITEAVCDQGTSQPQRNFARESLLLLVHSQGRYIFFSWPDRHIEVQPEASRSVYEESTGRKASMMNQIKGRE